MSLAEDPSLELGLEEPNDLGTGAKALQGTPHIAQGPNFH
jgi:hypothetical protein